MSTAKAEHMKTHTWLPPPALEELRSSLILQKVEGECEGRVRNSRDSCRHLHRPPRKSLHQEYDSEPHFPGRCRTVVLCRWRSRVPGFRNWLTPRESESPQTLMLDSALLLRGHYQTPNNTSVNIQGLGWAGKGDLECSVVSDPGKSHHPLYPTESWSHQAQERAVVWG